jgi:hypothetical protein
VGRLQAGWRQAVTIPAALARFLSEWLSQSGIEPGPSLTNVAGTGCLSVVPSPLPPVTLIGRWCCDSGLAQRRRRICVSEQLDRRIGAHARLTGVVDGVVKGDTSDLSARRRWACGCQGDQQVCDTGCFPLFS